MLGGGRGRGAAVRGEFSLEFLELIGQDVGGGREIKSRPVDTLQPAQFATQLVFFGENGAGVAVVQRETMLAQLLQLRADSIKSATYRDPRQISWQPTSYAESNGRQSA